MFIKNINANAKSITVAIPLTIAFLSIFFYGLLYNEQRAVKKGDIRVYAFPFRYREEYLNGNDN